MGTINNSDIWGFTSLNYGSNGYGATTPNFNTNVSYQNIAQLVILLNTGVSSPVAIGDLITVEDYGNHNTITGSVIDIGVTGSGLTVIWLSMTPGYASANGVSINSNDIFTYTAAPTPSVPGKQLIPSEGRVPEIDLLPPKQDRVPEGDLVPANINKSHLIPS